MGVVWSVSVGYSMASPVVAACGAHQSGQPAILPSTSLLSVCLDFCRSPTPFEIRLPFLHHSFDAPFLFVFFLRCSATYSVTLTPKHQHVPCPADPPGANSTEPSIFPYLDYHPCFGIRSGLQHLSYLKNSRTPHILFWRDSPSCL
jgi:hypothetical protein